MARCEDVGINTLVARRRQVLDAEWSHRLNIAQRDIATGMANDEVSALSDEINIAALRGYFVAVGARTAEVVHDLHPDQLDEVIDPVYLRTVVAQESILGANADWVEEYWQGKTRGWFLAQLGLTHQWAHMGEAGAVRGTLGYRNR